MRILRDSLHVGIPSTRANYRAQDISMWVLPKSCDRHMTLVSVSLGPKNLESVHIEGPSIHYGEGSIHHEVYPSITPFVALFPMASLIQYRQVYLNGSIILDFYPL